MPMTLHLLIFTFFYLGRLNLALGGEVDQFSHRHIPLSDSRQKINQHLNHYLLLAIEEANQGDSAKKCGNRKKKLYKKIQKYFNKSQQKAFLSRLKEDENIEKIFWRAQSSIYDDLGIKSIEMTTPSQIFLDPLIKVEKTSLGLDKLGHLFATGKVYFEKRSQGNDIEEILFKGILREQKHRGDARQIPGSFTYADLAAAFNGLLFWNDLLKEKGAILPQKNFGPYIECRKNRYILSRKVDIAHYVDDAFNESINCSRFTNPQIAQKIAEKIQSLGMNCPIEENKLKELKKKYGLYSKFILNFNDKNSNLTQKESILREQLKTYKDWRDVPEEIAQMLEKSYYNLQYKRGSPYIPRFRDRFLSFPSKGPYRGFKPEVVKLKKNLSWQERQRWYSFFSRSDEATSQYLEYFRLLHTNEQEELDLLFYTRSLSQRFSLKFARDHFVKELEQYKGAKLKERLVEASLDKNKIWEDSLLTLPQARKEKLGLFTLSGLEDLVQNENDNTKIFKSSIEYLKKEKGFSHAHVLNVNPEKNSSYNAFIIKQELDQYLSRIDLDKIVFIVISKGASDLIYYLLDYGSKLSPQNRKKVKLVISLTGLVRGSYLAQYFVKSKSPINSVLREMRFRSYRPLLRSLAQSPWREHNPRKVKALFPGLKWVSLIPIPDNGFGEISLSISSQIDFLSREIFKQKKIPVSIGDGLIESAATMLPPRTGIEEYVISYYGSHFFLTGSYDPQGKIPVSSIWATEKVLTKKSGHEVMDAFMRALPRDFIE